MADLSIEVPAAVINSPGRTPSLHRFSIGMTAAVVSVNAQTPSLHRFSIGMTAAVLGADAASPDAEIASDPPGAGGIITGNAEGPEMAKASEVPGAATDTAVPEPATAVESLAPSAIGELNAIPPGYSISVTVQAPPASVEGQSEEAAITTTVSPPAAAASVGASPPAVAIEGDVEVVIPAAPGTVIAVPPGVHFSDQPDERGDGGYPQREPRRPRGKDLTIGIPAARVVSRAVNPMVKKLQTDLDEELILLLFNG